MWEEERRREKKSKRRLKYKKGVAGVAHKSVSYDDNAAQDPHPVSGYRLQPSMKYPRGGLTNIAHASCLILPFYRFPIRASQPIYLISPNVTNSYFPQYPQLRVKCAVAVRWMYLCTILVIHREFPPRHLNARFFTQQSRFSLRDMTSHASTAENGEQLFPSVWVLTVLCSL